MKNELVHRVLHNVVYCVNIYLLQLDIPKDRNDLRGRICLKQAQHAGLHEHLRWIHSL